MDKYARISRLPSAEFRRLTGVKPETFSLMLTVYQRCRMESKRISGRPNTVSDADHILMMLEYNREYRTYFHIAESYGISESNAYKIIKRVENLLINSGDFSLPKKSTLYAPGAQITVVAIDATESPIERPKKNRNLGTQANINSII